MVVGLEHPPWTSLWLFPGAMHRQGHSNWELGHLGFLLSNRSSLQSSVLQQKVVRPRTWESRGWVQIHNPCDLGPPTFVPCVCVCVGQGYFSGLG